MSHPPNRRWLITAWIVLLFSTAWLLAYQVVSAPILAASGKESLVDLWFVGHFAYGVILAGCWVRIAGERIEDPWAPSAWFYLAVVSMFVWEGIELQMELGHFGLGPKAWMDGIEPISNRFFVDPIVGLVGMAACRRWPRIWLPTFAFGLLFEAAQVTSPTSMSIQEWLIASIPPWFTR